VVDGEAIACDDNGLAVFELIRYQRRPISRRRHYAPLTCSSSTAGTSGGTDRTA
jgi:hypothetical protein